MENSVWRPRAKLVSTCDVVFSILGIFLVLIIVLVFVHADVPFYFTGSQSAFGSVVMFLYRNFTAPMLAFILIASLITLFAALALKTATDPNANVVDAANTAGIWIVVASVFGILGAISNLILDYYILFGITLVIRSPFIYVVHRYIKELDGMARINNPAPKT